MVLNLCCSVIEKICYKGKKLKRLLVSDVLWVRILEKKAENSNVFNYRFTTQRKGKYKKNKLYVIKPTNNKVTVLGNYVSN
jgi:hypothetical protein